jgi:hypothetical protein
MRHFLDSSHPIPLHAVFTTRCLAITFLAFSMRILASVLSRYLSIFQGGARQSIGTFAGRDLH